MTVGEALAEARYRAGLTVDEVSERTRIREAVIRCIELDDYDACGGDLYVRGYVRAIAGAVGIDAQPLIREYDAERADAAPNAPNAANAAGGRRAAFAIDPAGTAVVATATEPEPPTVIDLPTITADQDVAVADPEMSFADPGVTIADPEFTIGDPEFTIADPEFTPTDPGSDSDFAFGEPQLMVPDPAPAEVDPWAQPFEPFGSAPVQPAPTAGAVRAASAPKAASPPRAGAPKAAVAVQARQPSRWRARIKSRRWVTGIAVLVVIVLAIAGFAGSRIAAHLSRQTASNSVAAQQAAGHQAQRAGAKTAPGARNAAGSAKGSKGSKAAKAPKAKAAPTKAPHALPVRWLPIELAQAFGPDGIADGDNPQSAQFAITPSSLPWRTDWYASADFGELKNGTGLLLDMGKTVTITSVRLDLSPYLGANLQLRLGNSATLTGLRAAASAHDVGGTVQLRLRSPVRARYVLIWFTLLPPNGAGQYQESVYRVVVSGRP